MKTHSLINLLILLLVQRVMMEELKNLREQVADMKRQKGDIESRLIHYEMSNKDE